MFIGKRYEGVVPFGNEGNSLRDLQATEAAKKNLGDCPL